MPKHNPKICPLSLCRILGSMKQERVHWRHYQTRYEAQQDILDYISMFYNSYRLHSYLDYKSPNQYEMEMTELRKAA
jgi:transposase InsO family protein